MKKPTLLTTPETMRLARAFVLSLIVAVAAQAQVNQTVGAGSAVTTVEGSANFNNPAALNDNPYFEGGMGFSRTGLTFNNNGCGYEGCLGAFPGFSGNYMYGVGFQPGAYGYFSMFTLADAAFAGLEFTVGSGYGPGTHRVFWEALMDGVQVATGQTYMQSGQVIGFAGTTQFDELRYTTNGENGLYYAPAFDDVRADFAVTATPEPASLVLMGSGLAAIAAARRRRKNKSA